MDVTYLQCRVADGQFSDEYAVSIEDYRGKRLSLFTHRSNASALDGLRVDVIEEQGDLLLVRLPSELIEPGGYFVTVNRKQCRTECRQ